MNKDTLTKEVKRTMEVVAIAEKREEKIYKQKIEKLKEIMASSDDFGFSFGFQAGFYCACQDFLELISELE